MLRRVRAGSSFAQSKKNDCDEEQTTLVVPLAKRTATIAVRGC
jgi:hypothetical protein